MSKANEIEVVTFKLDKATRQLMQGIDNRSEFIRNAILNALDKVCPFCKGSGVLTEHRKQHLVKLTHHHKTEVCKECDEVVYG